MKTKVMGKDGFSLDHEMIDLRYVEQITDTEQVAALSGMLKAILRENTAQISVEKAAEYLWQQMKRKGLECFFDSCPKCGYTEPRKQEIFLMLNRFRG